jgi:hypothetical protein
VFVQVIQGRVADSDRLRQQFDRWEAELAPGAAGYLGGTGGVADDGTFIEMARFESEDAARRNSSRPEQDRWWSETASCFEGEVTFHDTTDIEMFGEGGRDDAGFVQVVQGRCRDRERLEALQGEVMADLEERRPEIIGWVRAWYGDGEYSQFVYFTSEAEARARETEGPPADRRSQFEEWRNLMEDVRFIDLREPWLHSP